MTSVSQTTPIAAEDLRTSAGSTFVCRFLMEIAMEPPARASSTLA